jgi:hypothetical protein
MTRRRHPKNAPGPFYVAEDECIYCEAPVAEAPDLMTMDDSNGRYHCYFRRQPETAEEVDLAIRAFRVCCSGALRYGGDDPAIIPRILACDPKACDALDERKGDT